MGENGGAKRTQKVDNVQSLNWICGRAGSLGQNVRSVGVVTIIRVTGFRGVRAGKPVGEKKGGGGKKFELEGRTTVKKEIEKTDLDLSSYNSYHR